MAYNVEEHLSDELKHHATLVGRAFAQCIDPLLQQQFATDGFPATLCHYTDFGGLQGILAAGALWATDCRTMNDASEQQYGGTVVIDHCKKVLQGDTLEHLTTMMGHSHRNFAICFCETSNLLNMWLSYAARGGGYCLEFNGHDLLAAVFPPITTRIPCKISYGTVLPAPVQAILDHAAHLAQKGIVETSVAASWANLMALRIKHPAFAQEHEWRIVIQNPPASTLHFRGGHTDIKPYITLRPTTPDGNTRLPLQRIVFGPTLRQDDVMVDTIQMMLEHYGYHDIPVGSSGIPYRQ